MEQDWDNLIILDACRYDIFKEEWNFSGKLSEVISKGSATAEFLEKNFPSTYHDTVYVTGNPSVDKHLESEQFHNIIRPWKTHWNESNGTVMPSDMAVVTRQSHDRYPNKRIISHFIQPHQPFIGKKGQKLYDKHNYESTIPDHRLEAMGKEPKWDSRNIFLGLFQGVIDRGTIWEAYVENLKVTLPHVKKLVNKLGGKTIVTSDHGNIFKQPFIMPTKPPSAHPGGVYLDKLVRIPWLEINSSKRKDIVVETPENPSREAGDGNLSQRLRQLGYLEE